MRETSSLRYKACHLRSVGTLAGPRYLISRSAANISTWRVLKAGYHGTYTDIIFPYSDSRSRQFADTVQKPTIVNTSRLTDVTVMTFAFDVLSPSRQKRLLHYTRLRLLVGHFLLPSIRSSASTGQFDFNYSVREYSPPSHTSCVSSSVPTNSKPVTMYDVPPPRD